MKKKIGRTHKTDFDEFSTESVVFSHTLKALRYLIFSQYIFFESEKTRRKFIKT